MSPREIARKRLGGLSQVSKMPCPSWGIDARKCDVGSALFKVEGSVCSDCYALKGMYFMPNVRKALKKRYDIWRQDRHLWVATFIKALAGEKHFRWFDSGDVQGDEMLFDIMEVARHTPWCKHWLPTKEAWLVEKYRRTHTVPANMTVRLSLPMVDMKRPRRMDASILTAGVVESGESCPAKGQGYKCRDCRRCWSQKVKHVTYRKH